MFGCFSEDGSLLCTSFLCRGCWGLYLSSSFSCGLSWLRGWLCWASLVLCCLRPGVQKVVPAHMLCACRLLELCLSASSSVVCWGAPHLVSCVVTLFGCVCLTSQFRCVVYLALLRCTRRFCFRWPTRSVTLCVCPPLCFFRRSVTSLMIFRPFSVTRCVVDSHRVFPSYSGRSWGKEVV